MSSGGPDLLLVVPRHLRSTGLAELHDTPIAGHLDISRTYNTVRPRFFWPGLYRCVPRYVAACDGCQRRKRPFAQPAGLLHPIDVPKEPFFHVGMDLLGPFSTSIKGNK